MNKNEKTLGKFSEVMWGVAEDFGGKISKNGIKMRFKALQEYTIDQITQAGTWLLQNREKTFPAVPTTKEFIDAIGKVAGNLNIKTRAGIEVDKILSKIKRYGRAAEPLFFDETTKYLMTYRWSFELLGNMTANDLKWWRKDFIDAYQDTDQQKELVLDTAEKAGLIPADNLKKLTNVKRLKA
jgi:hypothetical protein